MAQIQRRGKNSLYVPMCVFMLKRQTWGINLHNCMEHLMCADLSVAVKLQDDKQDIIMVPNYKSGLLSMKSWIQLVRVLGLGMPWKNSPKSVYLDYGHPTPWQSPHGFQSKLLGLLGVKGLLGIHISQTASQEARPVTVTGPSEIKIPSPILCFCFL